MIDPEKFWQAMTRLAVDKGVSFMTLAMDAGLNSTTLYRAARTSRLPNLTTLSMILDKQGVSVKQFFTKYYKD